jgi:hypothetical protein
MSQIAVGNISIVLLIPVIGAALLLLIPRRQRQVLFTVALVASLAAFVWSLRLFHGFRRRHRRDAICREDSVDAGLRYRLYRRHRRYQPSSWCCSPRCSCRWRSSLPGRCRKKSRNISSFMLVLTTGVLGALVAWDLFLFYVFWEVMLVPMYLVIGVWGGERRIYAAIKFFLYTMAGSLLMLLAMYFLAWPTPRPPAPGASPTRTLMRLRPAVRPAALAVRRLRAGLRHQGADVPVPHLAARRPRRGADRRLGDPRRHPAQARHLRLPALRPAALPARRRGDAQPVLLALSVIGIIYGAAGRLGAGRHEEAGRLLVGRATSGSSCSGLAALELVAWEFRARYLSNDQPRPVDRRAVPPRRHALRPPAHQA